MMLTWRKIVLCLVSLGAATASLDCNSGSSGAPSPSATATVGPADGSSGSSGSTKCSPANTDSIQKTLLTPRCATAGCHVGAKPAADLDLSGPDLESRLLGRPTANCPGQTLVVPGDSAASYLYQSVAQEKPTCGQRMPSSAAALDHTDIDCLRTWIDRLPRGSTVDGGGPDAATPTCPDGKVLCPTGCKDLANDKFNCGACGATCYLRCEGSECKNDCVPPLNACRQSCIDYTSNNVHCGGCDQGCLNGTRCISSACSCGGPVSFSTQIEAPILATTCAVAGCHTGTTPSSGLVLDVGKAYAALVGVAATTCSVGDKKLVDPGVVDNSYLYNRVAGKGLCGGARMPKGRPPLTDAQVDLFRAWICSGAPNN